MGLWNELIPKILIKPKIKELKPAGGTYDTAADERKCYVIINSISFQISYLTGIMT